MPEVKMTERRLRLRERNERIREAYKKEWARGFRAKKIIDDLTKSYHLDATTIEAIVFKKGVYDEF